MDAQVLSSLKTAAVVGGVGLLLLGIWFFSDFFLLLFAGILWGVGLTGVARFGAHHGRMPYSVSLTVSLLVLSGAVALAGWYIGPKVVDGLQELRKMIPETFEEFRSEIRHFGLLHQLSDRLSAAGASLMDAETFGRIAGMLSTTLGVVTAGFFILLTGIYFAVRPGVYQRGIERLVVPRHRAYAREILHELAHSLRWWLLGRMLALIVVGVLTWTGLFALGIESAATLAFVAAVLSVIPNIGPLLSVIPAALVGWAEGPTLLLWVLLLYLVIQTLESYLITPLIEQSNLDVPPALLLSAQFLLGLMFGILGLLLAAPLLVVALVLVRMLYIRNLLKDPIELP